MAINIFRFIAIFALLHENITLHAYIYCKMPFNHEKLHHKLGLLSSNPL